MNRFAALVLAWWFLWLSDGKTVGPFATQADCEKVRTQMQETYKYRVTWCWWDGNKP